MIFHRGTVRRLKKEKKTEPNLIWPNLTETSMFFLRRSVPRWKIRTQSLSECFRLSDVHARKLQPSRRGVGMRCDRLWGKFRHIFCCKKRAFCNQKFRSCLEEFANSIREISNQNLSALKFAIYFFLYNKTIIFCRVNSTVNIFNFWLLIKKLFPSFRLRHAWQR